MGLEEELRNTVDKHGLVDVGPVDGTLLQKFAEEGYEVHVISVEQVGTGHVVKMKVLTKPGITWSQAADILDKIHPIRSYTNLDKETNGSE